jgi:hypothetical protein
MTALVGVLSLICFSAAFPYLIKTIVRDYQKILVEPELFHMAKSIVGLGGLSFFASIVLLIIAVGLWKAKKWAWIHAMSLFASIYLALFLIEGVTVRVLIPVIFPGLLYFGPLLFRKTKSACGINFWKGDGVETRLVITTLFYLGLVFVARVLAEPFLNL